MASVVFHLKYYYYDRCLLYIMQMSLYFMQYIVQCNINNITFIKHNNQIYVLRGSWCQTFEMMTF